MSEAAAPAEPPLAFISGTVGIRVARLTGAVAAPAPAAIAPARANAHADLMQARTASPSRTSSPT